MVRKKSSVLGTKPEEENFKPVWPALAPLIPVSDICTETILENQIVIIRKFFTKSLCQKYVDFLKGLPLTTTPHTPKQGNALRVNDRFQVNDPGFAEALYKTTALQDLIHGSTQDWGGRVVGLNPSIRVYRYTPGQFFNQHYDESNLIVMPGSPGIKAKTTWTLLLYLTDASTGCKGGETVFYPEFGQVKNWSKRSESTPPISIAPEVGMALLHKHGDDCMLHEGKQVIAGEKWIIRSDLCVLRE